LIHDRDPLFTAEFMNMIADAGVESVQRQEPGRISSQNFVLLLRRLGVNTGADPDSTRVFSELLSPYYKEFGASLFCHADSLMFRCAPTHNDPDRRDGTDALNQY
jgi:hypothetical protein